MNVLLGIEGSEESQRALDRTVDRAVEAGDRVTVAVLERVDGERSDDELVEQAEAALAEAGVEGEVRRLSGDPGSRLVELAEREGYDELVIGGGKPSPMGKIRLGSITEFVLLNAQVTVTLVR